MARPPSRLAALTRLPVVLHVAVLLQLAFVVLPNALAAASGPSNPTALLGAVAAVVAVGLAGGLVVLYALRAVTDGAPAVRGASPEQSRRAGFLRLRNPDAPGRARPRAPTRSLVAA